MAVRIPHHEQPRLLRLAYHLGLGPLVIAGRNGRPEPVVVRSERRRPSGRARAV
jgi:hypothetical protein